MQGLLFNWSYSKSSGGMVRLWTESRMSWYFFVMSFPNRCEDDFFLYIGLVFRIIFHYPLEAFMIDHTT